MPLRDNFKTSTIYNNVIDKKKIQNWGMAISALDEWRVFQHDDVKNAFDSLKKIRHASIHFNTATYKNLRDDALH